MSLTLLTGTGIFRRQKLSAQETDAQNVFSELRTVIAGQWREFDFAQLALNCRRSRAIASTRSLSKDINHHINIIYDLLT